MGAVADAAQAIAAAAGTVEGVRVYTDPTQVIDPPGVVVAAPRLYWDTVTVAPSRAVFALYVVTPADDRQLSRLWELVPLVAEAVSQTGEFGVDQDGATPTTFTSGSTSLPAYSISVTALLGG